MYFLFRYLYIVSHTDMINAQLSFEEYRFFAHLCVSLLMILFSLRDEKNIYVCVHIYILISSSIR